jgi:hypothetical protein
MVEIKTRTLRLSPRDIALAKQFPSYKKRLKLLYGRSEEDLDKLINSTLKRLNRNGTKRKTKKRFNRSDKASLWSLGARPIGKCAL